MNHDPGIAGVSPAGKHESGRDVRDPSGHRFWHSRGYLPHCDSPTLLQAITFRLADSLPADALIRLQQEDNDVARRRKIDAWLDAGHGECWLARPMISDIVEDALLYGDGTHYRLLAWCVMPNHVHVLIETLLGYAIPRVVQSWKSYSAKRINALLQRAGRVWMPDYFDRFIRDDHHLAAVVEYIHQNPVKAGLIGDPRHWRHSSAGIAGVPPAGKHDSGRDVRDPG